MENVVTVEAVHTHTHTHTQCNLIKEKINALLYAFNNKVNINALAGFMPAYTDKYKVDEFLI